MDPKKLAIALTAVELLNELTTKHTAFASFEEMVNAKGGYAPSISPNVHNRWFGAERAILAHAYDRVQEASGDLRRAYSPGLTTIAEGGLEGGHS